MDSEFYLKETLAWGFPKGSPYFETIDHQLFLIKESGLMIKLIRKQVTHFFLSKCIHGYTHIIGGIANKQAGYCWIGLLDCSIRIAIQFSWLDCDCQSKVKIGFWIWIVNPVFPFQSKSKTLLIIFHWIEISWSIMLHLTKAKLFLCRKMLWVDKRFLLGITCFTYKIKLLKFAVIIFFVSVLWLDLDWIVNPFWKVDLDLDWQSHICDGFGLDLQSKKIGLSNSLQAGC
jgi:hypothetical protein